MAHTGGDSGSHHSSVVDSVASGLLHPLTGTDHLAGMVTTTAGLHLAGMGLGRLVLAHQHRVRQAVSAALSLLGTWLLMQAA